MIFVNIFNRVNESNAQRISRLTWKNHAKNCVQAYIRDNYRVFMIMSESSIEEEKTTTADAFK
jgi:predicted DNA binding CopG/RHH family protein